MPKYRLYYCKKKKYERESPKQFYHVEELRLI